MANKPTDSQEIMAAAIEGLDHARWQALSLEGRIDPWLPDAHGGEFSEWAVAFIELMGSHVAANNMMTELVITELGRQRLADIRRAWVFREKSFIDMCREALIAEGKETP